MRISERDFLQAVRELARLREDLPPPTEKEPRPAYYRLVVPPPDWGGLA